MLSDRLRIVVAAFLLLSVVGAGVTYGAVIAPGTVEETRTVDGWESTTEFGHSATVEQQNPVYPVGTELENRSAYFSEASPILTGTHHADFDGDEGTVATQTTLTLVLRAEDPESGTVYWEQTDRLNRETAELVPGESVRTDFSVNVTAVRERLSRIESSLSTAGETTVLVRAETLYRGNAANQSANETVTQDLTIRPGSQVYEVDGGDAEAAEHTRTIVVREPVEAGAVETAGGPLLILLGLLGAGACVKADREGILDLTTHEQAALERAEFEDWVTIGGVPDDPPGERIRATSLEGLVDLAADTNARIIQDEHLGHYVVFGDEYHYLYEPLGRESL
ncbi:hypothetical protein JCM30237_09570 [Halolamina litorea]